MNAIRWARYCLVWYRSRGQRYLISTSFTVIDWRGGRRLVMVVGAWGAPGTCLTASVCVLVADSLSGRIPTPRSFLASGVHDNGFLPRALPACLYADPAQPAPYPMCTDGTTSARTATVPHTAGAYCAPIQHGVSNRHDSFVRPRHGKQRGRICFRPRWWRVQPAIAKLPA